MKKLNDTLLALILTALIFTLTAFSAKAKSGAVNGIEMCEGIIIPSLLPILIITNTILKSRAGRFFEMLFGDFFQKVLRLPRSAVTPVVFGLTGGFPAGAVLTLEQYKCGALSAAEADRIMSFNFCGGIAFIISAVGGYYGNTKTGVLLFIINIVSSFIIAAAGAIFGKTEKCRNTSSECLSLSDALCSAAETGSKSVIIMSAYIILFSALMNIVKTPQALTPLLEITNGIFSSKEKLPLQYCAFFLSFGGMCIHLQLAGMLSEMGIKYARFFIFRLASGCLSYFICKAFLMVFPESAPVFASSSSAMPFQFTEVNTALGIITMVGCAAIVLDIENRKIKL